MSDPVDVVLDTRFGLCHCGTIATRVAVFFHPVERDSLPYFASGSVKNCPRCNAPIGGFPKGIKIRVAAEFVLNFNGSPTNMAVHILGPVIDGLRKAAWLRPGVPIKASDPAISWLVATVAAALEQSRNLYRPELIT